MNNFQVWLNPHLKRKNSKVDFYFKRSFHREWRPGLFKNIFKEIFTTTLVGSWCYLFLGRHPKISLSLFSFCVSFKKSAYIQEGVRSVWYSSWPLLTWEHCWGESGSILARGNNSGRTWNHFHHYIIITTFYKTVYEWSIVGIKVVWLCLIVFEKRDCFNALWMVDRWSMSGPGLPGVHLHDALP